jgi:hypothetical protein
MVFHRGHLSKNCNQNSLAFFGTDVVGKPQISSSVDALRRRSRNLWTSARCGDKNLPLLCIYAKETQIVEGASHPLQLVIRLLIWGTLFWWCQPADVIVKEQINTRRGRGCMCPSDEVTFLPLFILVLLGSSFHHRARVPCGRRRRTQPRLLACRKLAQIGYSIYCTRLYLSPVFLRVLSIAAPLFYGPESAHTQMETARHLALC